MAIFLKAEWQNLIMANYVVPPHILQPYIPAGTTLDLFNGQAYMSLVGFLFKNTCLFGIPIPFLGTFEEINLRFYVSRIENGEVRRGVVFINESVPSAIVAYVANKLYKEHYTKLKTSHSWHISNTSKSIRYDWEIKRASYSISVDAKNEAIPMIPNSLEEFIFEHYWGYTKLKENTSSEYQIYHPSWRVNTVAAYEIQCDFEKMYGTAFSILNKRKPANVFLAEGSAVSVYWKRRKITV
jgi:uncharacterized protein